MHSCSGLERGRAAFICGWMRRAVPVFRCKFLKNSLPTTMPVLDSKVVEIRTHRRLAG